MLMGLVARDCKVQPRSTPGSGWQCFFMIPLMNLQSIANCQSKWPSKCLHGRVDTLQTQTWTACRTIRGSWLNCRRTRMSKMNWSSLAENLAAGRFRQLLNGSQSCCSSSPETQHVANLQKMSLSRSAIKGQCQDSLGLAYACASSWMAICALDRYTF